MTTTESSTEPVKPAARAIRALELFCGIGGFAAAVEGSNVRVVAALDHSPQALAVYRHNFPGHQARRVDLERVTAWELTTCAADLWWLSPPCQPYCERGIRRDLQDSRARSLLRLMEILRAMAVECLPQSIALENVAGFADSNARHQLVSILEGRGYYLRERLLCPSELGVPSRRPRYYLTASRLPLADLQPVNTNPRLLGSYLPRTDEVPHHLLLAPEIIEKFGSGLRILDREDPTAYTTCFTSGYGKSIVNAGSYLRCGDRVRYFSPQEISRLLHFPDTFSFPSEVSLRKQWHLIGNSLSVAAVQEILRGVPMVRLP
ncbi:DNA cytosine methyltransferase [Geobacter sp. DSM 9736]|uniref:DNA cytosine methyltransferase n=1 Tax=Geobacter sp. DSM 9736 TaxID=1277350 RepID=UPI000B5FBC14|nr:DNA cytosine methyltransferase [Geobacter sp. DSM 9736]SNB47364.1 DNA (cytosine-5)-methyltransferase 1/tRNA (cytosine38-C5)-methyltransferase [Geobacter sp. DSM 9736]